MPSLLRVSLIPLGRAHHSQQDPVYLPGDLSPINLQTQPLTRASPSPQLGCTHRNMAAQYSANCSLSPNF